IPGLTTQEVYTITFKTGKNESQVVANIVNGPADLSGNLFSLVDTGQFILKQTNPNLLLDEAAQVDILTLLDDDNPANSVGTLTNCRSTGLGMGSGGDAIMIVGHGPFNNGITFSDLEEVNITLGKGTNAFTIDTNNLSGVFTGQVTLNAGAGQSLVNVL